MSNQNELIEPNTNQLNIKINLMPHQEEWWKTSSNEMLIGGAAGSGKSFFMRMCAIWAALEVPNCQIYMFRRTRGELIQNHVEGATGFEALLNPLIKRGLVSYNKTDATFTFHQTQSKIFLCYCEKPGDVQRYQGMEISMLIIDELTQFAEADYRYLRARMRVPKTWSKKVPERWWKKVKTGGQVKKMCKFPWILTSSNPGGTGHDWVKRTFVDKCAARKVYKMDTAEGGMRRGYFPALLTDNVHLDNDYVEKLKGLGKDHLIKAWLEGDWNITADGMFSDVFMAQTHILEPFEIPKSWYFDYTMDWGYSKPYSIGIWAEADGHSVVKLKDGREVKFPKGTIFRIDELYGCERNKPNTGLRHDAETIANLLTERLAYWRDKGYTIKPGAADHNLWIGEVPTIAIYKKYGHNFRKADKVSGSRVNGWTELRKMMKACEPMTQGQIMEDPGFFVFSTCKDFIRTVPVLQRDERNMDDINTDQEDHIADETRYRILTKKQSFTINPIFR